jgi:ankyrin repeat protein
MAHEKNEIIAHMVQTEEFKSESYLPWSRGRGVDVWAMICAAITGDLETIKTLVAREPGLINCEIEYFTPIRFAVRENQQAVVEFLLEKGVNPAAEAGDTLINLARIRGYHDLEQLFETILRERYHIVPEGNDIAEAIRAFELDKVKSIIDTRPELVQAADPGGSQPIHWAALTRQIHLIDYLLQKGADINARRPDGARPIDLTFGDYGYRSWYRDLPANGLQNHEVVIGYLMARGAYCDISVAAKIGYYERVRELLDEDASLANQLPAYDGYYSGLPLRNAAAAGHIEIVKLLLSRGANVNEPEPGIAPFGGALHAAIGARKFDIVKLLLQHGANADADVESSGNCLFMASYVKAPQEIIDLIASHARKPAKPETAGDDPDVLEQQLSANPQMPVITLEKYVKDEKRHLVDVVLKYQPDALRKLVIDNSAWWDCNISKSAEYIRWLFAKGLPPNRCNWLGITILHRCAAKGNIEVAEACLDFGADINAIETEWSSTPLGWAAREGKMEMVEWLLQKGTDAHLPADKLWAQPIEWARRKGYENIVRLLETK